MSPDSERQAPGDLFRNVEAAIEQLRSAATTAPPESWLKKTLSSSPDQNEFNSAVVEVLSELFSVLRETAASQEKRLERLAEELRELRALPENLDSFRAQSDGVASELRSVAANVRGLHERAAALEAELAEAREQLAGGQGDLRREFQERIQHLLDEQRVCIRQLSLQASEEAVLADRARRATELKVEELARRVPPPPA